MISKLFYLFIAGGIGGFLGWMLQEPFLSRTVATGTALRVFRDMLVFGMLVGLCIGTMLGLASGWARGTMYQTFRGAALGGAVGLVGGGIGLLFGQTMFGALGGEIGSAGLSMPQYVYQLFVRGISFAVFGAFLGAAEGLKARSFRRGVQGMIGGAMGGFLGGFLFNIVGQQTIALQAALDPGKFEGGAAEVGIFSRAITLTLIGAAIGFFVGLIEMVAKQAWVRVVMGRNEGKEYLVDAAVTSIGRAESADIPIRGDFNILPFHAQIHKQGGQYALLDMGSPLGTGVNGQRIQHTPLRDGDQILIGGFTLEFREKAGAMQKANRDLQRAAVPPVLAPEGFCPYCGARKDASGNCACTVGAAPTAIPPVVPTMAGITSGSTTPTALVAFDGPAAGMRLEIGQVATTIGRDVDNTARTPGDPQTSRRHARIAMEAGEAVLYDEGSTNGTYVNGARVTRHALKRGDVIRIGATSFRAE